MALLLSPTDLDIPKFNHLVPFGQVYDWRIIAWIVAQLYLHAVCLIWPRPVEHQLHEAGSRTFCYSLMSFLQANEV